MAKKKRKKRRPLSVPRAEAPARPEEPVPSGTGAGRSESTSASNAGTGGVPATAGRAGASPGRAGRAGPGPPPAPWGSFPLSEIVVFIALVLLVAGFFVAPPRGAIMLGAGLVLGSLAGLELSVREHFAGYRSHTLLLAGAIGVAVLVGLLTLTKINPWICVGAAAAAFGAGAYLCAGAFRRHSGGSLFRFRG